MNAKTDRPATDSDETPEEIDFSKGTRGKFYRADARFILPVHLEADVDNQLTRSAEQEGVDATAFVAEPLEEHRAAPMDASRRTCPS